MPTLSQLDAIDANRAADEFWGEEKRCLECDKEIIDPSYDPHQKLCNRCETIFLDTHMD